ncbi:hypothetical protein TMSI_35480 [Klebsiella quasipneumoniae]|uniref:hypothetical protein n=1 Tax=Klebsiella quasipneumoniae TaxID=1463165 RepID=UPI001252B012|nr:hypothetical protein [Klebsiella quasipneumoniae]BBK13156.1 hypothetical protein TMSI_35480 [Klebsiella quasipneumoniae]
MTDITELAQRLKLEVHRAVSNFNPQMNIKTRDLKELVEALEKAQQRIAELESRTVTVKLPRPGFVTFSGERMAVYLKDDVDAVLAAAGIREAE